jgi:hypothetical protein
MENRGYADTALLMCSFSENARLLKKKKAAAVI